MVFFVRPPPDTHFRIGTLSGPLPSGTRAYYTLGGTAGAHFRIGAGTNPGDGASFFSRGATWPAGRWTCVQFQMDAAKGAIRLWIDGKAI